MKTSLRQSLFGCIYPSLFHVVDVLFRNLVNSMQNQVRSTKWHSVIDMLATPDLFHCFKLYFFS